MLHRPVLICHFQVCTIVLQYLETFPHLQSDSDERQAILAYIGQSLGYHYPSENFATECTLKALIVFGYFCSLCETILFEENEKKRQ